LKLFLGIESFLSFEGGNLGMERLFKGIEKLFLGMERRCNQNQ